MQQTPQTKQKQEVEVELSQTLDKNELLKQLLQQKEELEARINKVRDELDLEYKKEIAKEDKLLVLEEKLKKELDVFKKEMETKSDDQIGDAFKLGIGILKKDKNKKENYDFNLLKNKVFLLDKELIKRKVLRDSKYIEILNDVVLFDGFKNKINIKINQNKSLTNEEVKEKLNKELKKEIEDFKDTLVNLSNVELVELLKDYLKQKKEIQVYSGELIQIEKEQKNKIIISYELEFIKNKVIVLEKELNKKK
jgi:hypothetical protein